MRNCEIYFNLLLGIIKIILSRVFNARVGSDWKTESYLERYRTSKRATISYFLNCAQFHLESTQFQLLSQKICWPIQSTSKYIFIATGITEHESFTLMTEEYPNKCSITNCSASLDSSINQSVSGTV